MTDISKLPHRFDKNTHECQAIIETPRGRRNKFKYEPDSGLFALSNLLPEGFSFPFDFGFIPSTAAEDGDPLDVIVLMDEPAHVGCVLKVRVIGVIRMEQTEKGEKFENDRLVAVADRSFMYQNMRSISDLQKPFLDQIVEFLTLYNKNSGKQDELQGVGGPEHAVQVVANAIKRFDGR